VTERPKGERRRAAPPPTGASTEASKDRPEVEEPVAKHLATDDLEDISGVDNMV
jgi:hypothetical protein